MKSSDNSPVIESTDILIVGGGLVGTAMAVLLASSEETAHLKITLVDPVVFNASFSDERFDARVVALTEPSKGLLQRLNAWQALDKRSCAYSRMEVKEAEGSGAIAFDANEAGLAWLGHIAENSVIVGQLLQRVEQLREIDFRCPAKVVGLQRLVDQAGFRVELDTGQAIDAGLVIAADGANSAVRQLLGFSVREWPYGQDAIVTTIRTELPHNNTARQWFMPTGPLAYLPLSGSPDATGHSCSIVWSQQTEEAGRLMALSDNAFCKTLSLITCGDSGAVIACDKRFNFPLRQRHADRYIKPGVALIGDAAHSIHPLAGQGVNLGFQDVLALHEAICWGVKVGVEPGNERLLQRFQRQRKPDNLRMMLAMEGFKQLFSNKQPLLRMLRSEGLSQLNKLSPVKNRLIKEAMGL